MKKIVLITMASIAILAYACKDKTSDPTPAPVAGLGGIYSLAAFPKHHDKPIPHTRIFIKYNATAFPGTDTTKYDNVLTAVVDGSEPPHAHFNNLKLGNYYFYGVGFDSSINLKVTGGIPVIITSTDATEKDIVVPVTE